MKRLIVSLLFLTQLAYAAVETLPHAYRAHGIDVSRLSEHKLQKHASQISAIKRHFKTTGWIIHRLKQSLGVTMGAAAAYALYNWLYAQPAALPQPRQVGPTLEGINNAIQNLTDTQRRLSHGREFVISSFVLSGSFFFGEKLMRFLTQDPLDKYKSIEQFILQETHLQKTYDVLKSYIEASNSVPTNAQFYHVKAMIQAYDLWIDQVTLLCGYIRTTPERNQDTERHIQALIDSCSLAIAEQLNGDVLAIESMAHLIMKTVERVNIELYRLQITQKINS